MSFTVRQTRGDSGSHRLSTEPSKPGDAFPDFGTWDRICNLYGWPQTFVSSA